MTLKISSKLNEIMSLPNHWSANLLSCCENSGTIGGDSGWHPLYLSDNENFSWGYLKTHSYGEYIFDWAWADLYQRVGTSYYPKLIHALPFTPLSAKKVYGHNQKETLNQFHQFYLGQEILSSDHWLFIDEDQASSFLDLGYFHQKTIQYHFFNRFKSFDEYLGEMKARKRKQIKKERQAIFNYNLQIRKKSITELEHSEIEQVYQLYLSTIDKKHSMAYLNQSFFTELRKEMSEDVFFYFAYKDDQLIAMSMFFEDSEHLYGRYWGILPEYQEEYPFLHFELCYYRGIEYVIENQLQKFEAGAQGEQKLLRGFEPITIHSFHHLRNKELSHAVENHVQLVNERTEEEIKRLACFLPFK